MNSWIVVGVDTSVPWPTSDTEVEFDGHKLLLRPGSHEQLPTIAFQYSPHLMFNDALLIVRRFMSSLAWVKRAAVKEEGIMGGGIPIRIGRPGKGVITQHFRQDYLPAPEDRRVRLALALYREALGLNSVAYAFLGFFKIINLVKNTGREQKDWINGALSHIKDYRALGRKSELVNIESDVGGYLYESGRCAVAHAYSEPIVNPEDCGDLARLTKDLPLIQALAEFAIESEFGVQSQDTIWREHLYQLDGFREVLGPETVDKIKQKKYDELPPLKLPKLSLRVREKEQLSSLHALLPAQASIEDGIVWLRCRSESGVFEAVIGLDLSNELLLFDPDSGVGVRGTNQESIRAQIDHLQLLKGLLCNGCLEVRSADSGKLLGRTDPYYGHNIDAHTSMANIERSIDHLRSQLDPVGSELRHDPNAGAESNPSTESH